MASKEMSLVPTEIHSALTQVDPFATMDKVLARLSGVNQLSQILLKSSFVPEHLNTVEKVQVVILKCMEMNLPYMLGVSHMYPVKGKVACEGVLLAGLMQKAGVSWEFKRHDAEACEMLFKRKGFDDVPVTFNKEMATRAGLMGPKASFTWNKYPEDMLYWKCIARGAKKIAADVTSGLALAGELDPQSGIDINPDGSFAIEAPNPTPDYDLKSKGIEYPKSTAKSKPDLGAKRNYKGNEFYWDGEEYQLNLDDQVWMNPVTGEEIATDSRGAFLAELEIQQEAESEEADEKIKAGLSTEAPATASEQTTKKEQVKLFD